MAREFKVYTEEDHLSGLPNETIELYEALKERVLRLGDNIEVRPMELYIGFVAGTNFVNVHIRRMQLKLWINLPKENWMTLKIWLESKFESGCYALAKLWVSFCKVCHHALLNRFVRLTQRINNVINQMVLVHFTQRTITFTRLLKIVS